MLVAAASLGLVEDDEPELRHKFYQRLDSSPSEVDGLNVTS